MIRYSLSYRKVTVKNSSGAMVVAYKAYATINTTASMTQRQFLDHLENAHNTVYSRSDLTAMLWQLAMGAIDIVKDGYKVPFGDMGFFYPAISAQGVTDPSQFSTVTDIRNCHINWQKSRVFANLANGKYAVEFDKVQTDVNKANAIQANNAGNNIMVLHTSASKEAAFA